MSRNSKQNPGILNLELNYVEDSYLSTCEGAANPSLWMSRPRSRLYNVRGIFTLVMKAAVFTDTQINLRQITCRHIPEEKILNSQILKFNLTLNCVKPIFKASLPTLWNYAL
jgi:hypothetical protein